MNIHRVGGLNAHTEVRNSVVPSFKSEEEKNQEYKNAENLIITATTGGLSITGICLYLKAKGPALMKKFFERLK